jgi:hypothetical protein
MYKALAIQKIRQKYKNTDIIQDTLLTNQHCLVLSCLIPSTLFQIAFSHQGFILISRKGPSKLVKFEFEQFSTIEDVFLYLVSVAPYMKQLLPVSSYRGYVFSIVPLSPLSGEVWTMVYTKGSINAGIVEFDVSTKKYKSVTAVERADKNYFVILIPKSTTISDSAIVQLESSKTRFQA